MTMDLNIISRQRVSIMGLAIWMILLYHSWQDYCAVGGIFRFGDIGVGLFALISGFGCYRSLSQKSSKEFLLNRVERILPSFIVATSIIAIYRHIRFHLSAAKMALLISGMAVFRGDMTVWFTSFIGICYLFAPILFWNKSKKNAFGIATLISILVSVLFLLLLNNHLDSLDLWLLRVPIFVLGFDLAPIILNEKINPQIDKLFISYIGIILAYSAVACLCFASRDYCKWRYIIYFISCLPIIFSIAYLIERFPSISRLFGFFGSFTLEIYLGNRMVRNTIAAFSDSPIASTLVSLLLSLILALALRQITLLFNKLRKKESASLS